MNISRRSQIHKNLSFKPVLFKPFSRTLSDNVNIYNKAYSYKNVAFTNSQNYINTNINKSTITNSNNKKQNIINIIPLKSL